MGSLRSERVETFPSYGFDVLVFILFVFFFETSNASDTELSRIEGLLDRQANILSSISDFGSPKTRNRKVPLLAEESVVHRSIDPERMYLGTPSIEALKGGVLLASFDSFGKRSREVKGASFAEKSSSEHHRSLLLRSVDGGSSWHRVSSFDAYHGRVFQVGDVVYWLGVSAKKKGGIVVSRSNDQGKSWGEPAMWKKGVRWHQSACSVWIQGSRVALVMEKTLRRGIAGWEVANKAPVLFVGNAKKDLTKEAAWQIASDLVFEDVFDSKAENVFGLSFFRAERRTSHAVVQGRIMHPMGWLETNVVQFPNKDHLWHDPSGNTFHLLMRAHTGFINYAAMCKVRWDKRSESWQTVIQRAPSGQKMLFVPLPGGQMRFNVLYDHKQKYYWLLSSQSTSALKRPSLLPEKQAGLPGEERHRLQLHFSQDGMSWIYAGLVTKGKTSEEARNYASMSIDGEDIVVLCRSGDEHAKSSHDNNLITFHRVKAFRDLIY